MNEAEPGRVAGALPVLWLGLSRCGFALGCVT